MERDDFKSAQFAALYNALTASADATIASLDKQLDRIEYQQWQEGYRRLVFAQEIRVSHTEPPMSRRARRRQRKQK